MTFWSNVLGPWFPDNAPPRPTPEESASHHIKRKQMRPVLRPVEWHFSREFFSENRLKTMRNRCFEAETGDLRFHEKSIFSLDSDDFWWFLMILVLSGPFWQNLAPWTPQNGTRYPHRNQGNTAQEKTGLATQELNNINWFSFRCVSLVPGLWFHQNVDFHGKNDDFLVKCAWTLVSR